MEYDEIETSILANIITKMQKQEYFAQQYMLGMGLKEFKEEGPPAYKAELNQMHKHICFKAIYVS